MKASDRPVDSPDPAQDRQRDAVESIAGLFAAAALFMSLVALAYRPLPISVASVILALIACGMSSRHRTLCAVALLVAGVCFVAGMTIAAVTSRPLW